jgi:hypothetical protein
MGFSGIRHPLLPHIEVVQTKLKAGAYYAAGDMSMTSQVGAERYQQNVHLS